MTKAKTTPNPNNIYLTECLRFSDMDECLPYSFVVNIDDSLTGFSRLDLGGNTRPVSKGLLFSMLRDLDEISTQTVRDYTKYSDSYCRKLASLMRIAVNALNRMVDGFSVPT